MKKKITIITFAGPTGFGGYLRITGIVLMFLSGFNLYSLIAQESVNAAGGEAAGSGGSVSYSVGQVFFSTFRGTDGSVAEGVQQPFEVSVVTSVEEALGITLEMAVYPNPVTDYLILRVMDYERQDLSYQLFDVRGGLVLNGKVTDPETKIMMAIFTPGVYLLRVMDNMSEAKTFRIIKN